MALKIAISSARANGLPGSAIWCVLLFLEPVYYKRTRKPFILVDMATARDAGKNSGAYGSFKAGMVNNLRPGMQDYVGTANGPMWGPDAIANPVRPRGGDDSALTGDEKWAKWFGAPRK
mgnify:CR=1 FL=1